MKGGGSEERAQAEWLARELKMEVIGQFAGKVAHDFNNVLTAIIGYSNLFLIKLKPDDPLRVYAEQILSAAERGAQITEGLLHFGSKQVMNALPVDLNRIMTRAAGRISPLLGKGIEFTLTLWPEPLGIIADIELIEQMLLNLAGNACDAMPDGGSLTVRTEAATPSADQALPEGDDEASSWAVISVEDRGHGMDQATLERIFEPLYTTKPKGKGLGLGLAVVYGIIRQHGGTIRVASQVGKGTIFRILLPLMKKPASEGTGGMQQLPRTERGHGPGA